jgi:pyruvate dehydrogenase E2 component (dihydrolipoamide acetyltransferase)
VSNSAEAITAADEPATVITQAEIAKAASASGVQEEYKLGQVVPLDRLQKLTGQRMLQSKRQIPCFYLTVWADVTGLVKHREQINQGSGPKVSYNDFIILAAAMGLERFEIMTGQVEGEAIKLADSIGVGLAISVPGGVVAPVVKDVNKKDVRQIARDTAELTERAQKGRLSPNDLEGGCITISNLGAFGVESFIPVVVPGQCSILGIGAIMDKPVPDAGQMVIRKLINVTLSVDHRVTNGAYAGQFLDYVRKLLEDASVFD